MDYVSSWLGGMRSGLSLNPRVAFGLNDVAECPKHSIREANPVLSRQPGFGLDNVRPYRRVADVECGGDFLVLVALQYQPDDLGLPGRERQVIDDLAPFVRAE